MITVYEVAEAHTKHSTTKGHVTMGNHHKTFTSWLEDQIWKQRITYSEVARRGGISHARISQVLAGDNPGWEFVAAVARALDQDLDLVAHKAGLWEGGPDRTSVQVKEYTDLFSRLPAHERSLILQTMRAWDLYAERQRRIEQDEYED